MAEITQVTDHQDQAKARLLDQYKKKPRVEGLLDAFVAQVQNLEDTLIDLLNDRWVDSAEGLQLDKLGQIVAIARNGLDDDRYRLRIKAKILTNVSQGEPETIIQIFRLLHEAELVILQEVGRGDIVISGDGPEITDEDEFNLVASLLDQAMPGGGRVQEIGFFESEDAFAFDEDDYEEGGFGDALDPTAGGQLGALYDF